MEPLIRATLYLVTEGHFDPAVVTERTGLAMDRGWSLGDVHTLPNGFVRPPATSSCWTYQPADFERTVDMESVLCRLLDRLDPVEQDLVAVREEFGLKAHITLNVQMEDGATPDGTLRAATLARLVALAIDLDLDLYPR